MDHANPCSLQPSTESVAVRSSSERVALALLIGHLMLLCCVGKYYAKFYGVGPLYVTELLLIVTAVLSWRSVVAVPWDRLTKLVALFVAFGIFWAVLGGIGDPAGAGAKAISFFAYSAFYFIVRGLARDDDTRSRVLHRIALATIGAALIGIVQTKTGVPLLDPSGRFEVTTTGSTRWLSGEYAVYALVGMSVPAIAAIITRRIGRASTVLIISAAVELVLAQHRSGFLAAGVALFATTIFIGESAQAVRGLVKLVVFGTVAVGVYLLLFGGGYLEETVSRVSTTTDLDDNNIYWRLNCAYEVLGAVAAQPFGHGFSTWDFSFTIVDPLTGSHNDYLDLAYRIGVPGLVAFLAIPVSLILQTRQLAQRTGPVAQLLPITACGAMLAFLIFASFNVALESPQVSILFWVLLGLGAGSVYDRQRLLRS